jgi:hypothetical protein
MLMFFDETFRTSLRQPTISFGALCGIGIPERSLGRIAADVYQLKLKHLGADFARDEEIKGKEVFKNYVFSLARKGIRSRNLALGEDLLEYIHARQLPVFGCVCFERAMQRFQVDDVASLDRTFRYLFERVDMHMKIHHPDEKALLVFDDRDYGINRKNAEAITNFFQRSALGLSMDAILPTPFFAISQAQNVGLQLADLVTTVIGLRFSSHREIEPYFANLKRSIARYHEADGRLRSGLKVIRA